MSVSPRAGRVIAVTGLAREARIAASPLVRTVARGGDARALAPRIAAAIAEGCEGVMSFGIAGGLDAALVPGTWLVARAVVTAEKRWDCDAEWTRDLAARLPGSSIVDLAGSDDIVASTAAKRMLRAATGAAAVDTESHVAAALAAANELPFAAFRVVIDAAGSDLPAAATVALDAGGGIDLPAVLQSLARRPGQLPALMRTALNARTAFDALSRGRRLLGASLACPDLGELLLDLG